MRYFDPARRRAGVPEDVAVLVERLTADEATLNVVNLNPVHERVVIVQGGAYASTRSRSVTVGAQATPVGRPHLRPSSGARCWGPC